MKIKKLIIKIIITLLLTIFIMITLFPLYWMIITSIAPGDIVMTYPPHFIPTKLTSEWWFYAIESIKVPLINTFIIAFSTAVISTLLGFISGYGFARFRSPKDNILFWILSIKFMPAIVAVIPYYLLFSKLNLLDTYIAVIIPHLTIGIPFAVWLLRSTIKSIPIDIEEAALIDGCSRLRVLFRIIFPLALPSILVTLLFTFIWSWNEFMFALILTDVKARVLTVTIAGMREAHGLMWGAVSASATIAAIPTITLAVLLQKYLVTGLSFYRTKG